MKGKPLNLVVEEANQQDLKKETYKGPEGDPKGKEELVAWSLH